MIDYTAKIVGLDQARRTVTLSGLLDRVVVHS